jgi:hypothetical protein
MTRISARNAQYWINKGYAEPDAVTMARSRMPGTIEYFEIYKKYSKEEAILKSKEWNSNKAVTESNMIKKYGKDEGLRRWEEYKKKQAYSNTFEYKEKKYGWSREAFDEFNKSRAITLENLIEKYGEVRGNKKYNDYVEKQRYTNQLEYFIEKYGEDGQARFDRYCKLKSHTYESYLERFDGDEEKAIYELNKYYIGKSNVYNSSSICIEFCKLLHEKIDLIDNYTIYYEGFSEEYYFGIPRYGRAVVDFYVKELNKVIEFYGDYWHCNPNIYSAQDIVSFPKQKKICASEVWERDSKREEALKSIGVEVLIIWEQDYRLDASATIETALNWLIGEK